MLEFQPIPDATGPLDLSKEINRKIIAAQILTDIDLYCQETYDKGHRTHLGASVIGHVCRRYIFNTFRWVKHTKHSGRMQRLWNRGHREEARFIEWLRGIGFEVKDLQPQILHFHLESNSYMYASVFNPGDGLVEDVTGIKEHIEAAAALGIYEPEEQFRFSACMGHYGGSLDGESKPPARYNIAEPFLLCEFKTQGTGSGFEKLKSEGVKKNKPQHYAQMVSYGKQKGYNYSLYMCINKNDDDLYIEIVPLDWSDADALEMKADDIIRATVPPEKFAFSEAVYECKYCDFVGICHRGEQAEKNCRSCINSAAIDNGKWWCRLYNQAIPEDFIPKGCDNWQSMV